ncbi:hypothetical protein F442_06342 [Phytophthora nicotianae P10297]|uniref:Uncharacterized protein n=1 Tax=Phytophthora nicotianae P10297 TaxID=1317064 RepID=W2ZKA1_PHYNI|nr:hypothetical protein F442_06342 [Phytophthora nicotianae P10297]
MVFRFSNDQDKELLRELIRLKPFAAVRGTTLRVWSDVAASLSSAFGVEVNVKQIRDRLTLLKQSFKDSEAACARGSGIEESVDAVNVQSHYDEREGLVREYVALEDHFKSEKKTVKTKKQQKDEQLAISDGDSSVSRCSTVSGASSRTPRSTPKRVNAFQQEIKRQEKRQRLEFELKEQELRQSQQQFEQRLIFEKERDDQHLRFQERLQKSNQDLIIECAQIFCAAISRKDN